MSRPIEALAPAKAEDEPARELLERVGSRLRAARRAAGLTQRALSERSGVSPRYLVHLEAGTGNVSLGVLSRVAAALGLRVEDLVCAEPPPDADGARLLRAYAGADEEARAQALALLEESGRVATRAGRIALLGMRGAGKSTLGRMLAERLGLPFVELNREIEAQAGMAVAEIMALYGEEGYRQFEAQALERVSAGSGPMVLAVAGGIVAEPATFGTLLRRFHTVWLRATPAEHMNRVLAQGDTRPMAGNPRAMEQLRRLLVSREPFYARAEAQLDTSGRSVEEAADDLAQLVEERGFLRH